MYLFSERIETIGCSRRVDWFRRVDVSTDVEWGCACEIVIASVVGLHVKSEKLEMILTAHGRCHGSTVKLKRI